MLVPLDSILSDATTQARHETDQAVAAEYAEAMRDGATFPPVVLYRDGGGTLRVGDGYHRVSAARLAGHAAIDAEVRAGGAMEALEHSIRANARHGLRFTNADKRRAVGLMLDDAEWSRLPDREIARRCGVSQPFVGKIRAERGDNGYQSLADEIRAHVEKHESCITDMLGHFKEMLEAMRDVRRLLGPDRYAAWFAHEKIGGEYRDDVEIALDFYPEFRPDVIPSIEGR